MGEGECAQAHVPYQRKFYPWASLPVQRQQKNITAINKSPLAKSVYFIIFDIKTCNVNTIFLLSELQINAKNKISAKP